MEPEYKKPLEYPAVNRKPDFFGAVMNCLTAGELDSARTLCQLHCCKPTMAQLLLGCGRLTSEELDDLLLVHRTAGLESLPLGTFLVHSGCLTGDELRNFLVLQRTLRLAERQPERWGQKLVRAGILSPEQLQQALTDRITGDITLRQAILNRGWLNEAQLDKIF